MTPSLVVNVRIRGWGRLKKASGSQDLRVRADMTAFVRLLGARRRFDILDAIRMGSLSLPYAFGRYEQEGLDALPVGPALLPLIPAFEAWLEEHQADEHHRANQWSAWRKIRAHATAMSRLADLPALLERVRGQCVRAGTASMFNRTREAVSAFLKAAVKRRHPLYQDVRDIPPLAETRAKGHPQTPAEVQALAARLGPLGGPMWWTLCLTGMRPKEYFEKPWEIGPDRIVVHNAKRAGTRLVPLVRPPATPTRAKRWLMNRILKATGGRVSLYDARRTFAVWCEQTGVPKTRIDLYLGHGAKTILDRYTWHDVTAFLENDAAALRMFVEVGCAHQLELRA